MWRVANALGMAGLLLLSLALTGCGRSGAPEVEPSKRASVPPSQAATDSSRNSAQAAQPAVLQIRPSKLTAGEWKRSVAELPAVFRAGLTGTDEEKARALGLLARRLNTRMAPFSVRLQSAKPANKPFKLGNRGLSTS